MEVVAIAKGFFSFFFSYDEYLRDVFTKGPWSFRHLSLVLHPWEPGMVLSKCLSSSAPVWVKLPKFPLEYWDEEFFKVVANSLE